MKAILEQLKGTVKGDFYFDDISKRIYSIDASIFQVTPTAVVVPKDSKDIENTVKACARNDIAVVPRGAATGINGGCIGSGVVIDTSRYMTKILDVNYEEGYALCQPGVVQDQLNSVLEHAGYCLGPDTSTGNRATLGGMVGNNAAGAHSIRYGKMVDHVISCRIILSNGEAVTFEEETEESFDKKLNAGGRVAEIYKCVDNIRKNHKDDIKKAFPEIQRRVSGYNLDEVVKDFPFNMAKVIVGSEGTFGITDRIKVKISPKPAATVLCVMLFDDMEKALSHIDDFLKHELFSLELIDKNVIEAGRNSPSMKGKLDWLEGTPEILLAAEFDASTPGAAIKKLEKFQEFLVDNKICTQNLALLDKASQNKVWKLRKAGLGLLMSNRSHDQAIAFLEDVAVPPQKLASYIKDFKKYFKDHDKDTAFYGHAGAGCIHVRPILNLRKDDDLDLMVTSMNDISELIKKYGGALSGEHGDGLTRSWLNEKMFGEKVYQLFKDLKKAFDPVNLMNPGKIVDGPPPTENLKVRQEESPVNLNTMFSFEKEGGWNFALEMCNGNGECRKSTGDLMCPSFQAYGDERHSTRARAQALHSVMNGGLSHRELLGSNLHKVLDLCIECKGCKTECPSNVDMAKMKSEYLYHYQEKNGYKLRDRLFANISSVSKTASRMPGLVNFSNSLAPVKWALNMVGITSKREIPHFARKTFTHWQKSLTPALSDKKVVLFNDTFNQYNTPRMGMYAVSLLNKAGYDVIIPPYQCCGRSMISKGFLKKAKERATSLIETLHPYAQKGYSIVGLEPSCILTIADDYRDLIATDKANQVADACMTLDKFLGKALEEAGPELKFMDHPVNVKYHGHCHQKAIEGTSFAVDLLNSLPGVNAEEIDSGCCGMAGSFGYEKEHYEFSMQIGEKRLLPTVRKASVEDEIISNGMSCRCQISHGANRNALHLVEFINSRSYNPAGSTIM